MANNTAETSAPKCETCPVWDKSIFRGLSIEQVEELRQYKSLKVFKRGQVLASEGVEPDGIYCILKGSLKYFRSDAAGKEQLLHFAGEGGSVGASPTTVEKTMPFSVSALTETVVCHIEREPFFELTRTSNQLLLNIINVAYHFLALKDEAMYLLTRKSVRQRVAQALLFLADNFSTVTAEGRQIYLPLSRQEIAAFSGTVLENAVRHLSEFRTEGYILTHGKQIIVTNPEKLKEITN